MIRRVALAVCSLALLLAVSPAAAVTISVSTDILNSGSAGAGNVADNTTSATAEINYVRFIPNNATATAVQYDFAGNTTNLSPNIFAAGAARGAGQGIQVNTYGPIGGSNPGGTTNSYLVGQANTNNPGFGAHSNWVVTLNLDTIRTNRFGGPTALNLTGTFGTWGAIGQQDANAGNIQGEIRLDGTRIDGMPLSSFSPPNNPTFNLNIPSTGHELSFFILNSATSSNWDDGIFQNVNLTAVPEPSTLILSGLGAVGLFVIRRRRKA